MLIFLSPLIGLDASSVASADPGLLLCTSETAALLSNTHNILLLLIFPLIHPTMRLNL